MSDNIQQKVDELMRKVQRRATKKNSTELDYKAMYRIMLEVLRENSGLLAVKTLAHVTAFCGEGLRSTDAAEIRKALLPHLQEGDDALLDRMEAIDENTALNRARSAHAHLQGGSDALLAPHLPLFLRVYFTRKEILEQTGTR